MSNVFPSFSKKLQAVHPGELVIDVRPSPLPPMKGSDREHYKEALWHAIKNDEATANYLRSLARVAYSRAQFTLVCRSHTQYAALVDFLIWAVARMDKAIARRNAS